MGNLKTKSFGEEKNKLVIQSVGIKALQFLYQYYDELFDYSFDIDENKNSRLKDILLQIKEINLLDYSDLVNIVKNIVPKIEHNYHHLYNLKSRALKDAYSNNIKIKI